jgi:NAD(P)-dependent dehydrogenase (short-subunit alcohol dehydrogenase family)
MGTVTEPRTILITGATDGLGYSLAHQVVALGDTVVLHGRNPVKLEETATSISELYAVPRPLTVLADLADLSQVRRMGADVLEALDRLDVLVNNAGVGAGEPDGRTRRVSVDGFELRFAVNYLAGQLLTLELLPLLRRSAPARVVNVASIRQEPLDFSDLMLEHHYSGVHAYGQSKLAQIMGGFDIAARVPSAEVTVNSLHPATYMPTKMVLKEVGDSIDSLEEGVASTLRLVSGPEGSLVTGKFFDRAREAKANAQAYDADARAELWALTLAMVDHPGL